MRVESAGRGRGRPGLELGGCHRRIDGRAGEITIESEKSYNQALISKNKIKLQKNYYTPNFLFCFRPKVMVSESSISYHDYIMYYINMVYLFNKILILNY